MTVSRSLHPTSVTPVYEGYFADPFVWNHEGTFYAVGTGEHEASGHPENKIFPLLQSRDLISWTRLQNALLRPAPALGGTFWAPAVARDENTFYLYYSVGHGDRSHQLRVAVSSTPAGPYEDLGKSLLDPSTTPFAIDPHPFQDHDGARYLFYARDFLDAESGARPGTALAVNRMKTMTQLEGVHQVVLRARSDWQRFQCSRQMYGAIWDWHTLEGPCVVRHNNRYYCFYSGGCWQDQSYGVDYGVASSPMGPYSDAGNEHGPRVLATGSFSLIGPGHNSWIIGPDGEEFLVFHAWDQSRAIRQMFIQHLLWTEQGPRYSPLGILGGTSLY